VPRDPPAGDARREYAAASHLRLALAAGGVDDGLEPRVNVSGAARVRAEELLRTAGVRDPEAALGLVAAGTWRTKTWPAAHAAWLARRLLAAGRELLLLAGPGEEHVTTTLTALAPGIAVLPRCDVPDLAAVIERLGGV